MFARNIAAAAAVAPINRRDALRLAVGAGAGLGAGLIVGFRPAPADAATDAAGASAPPFNAFVRVGTDDLVTVFSKHLDKGQGVTTGLATLVAEELDARHDQMRVEFAPANVELYKNLFFGVQGTGGSTGIANSFDQYRTAAATARALLIEAAAEQWSVDAALVVVEDGALIQADSGRRTTFGAVAEAAAARTPPAAAPRLKDPADWRYIGKSFPRVDAPMKTTGAVGAFGIDVDLPGMLTAVMARPPKFGATPRTIDQAEARRVDGLVDIVATPYGVATVAKTTWPAIKARDLLVVDWDESEAETRGDAEILAEYQALAETPGVVFREDGDAAAGLAGAARVIDIDYAFPFLAHAALEPFNITVQLKDSGAEFWFGSQLQTVDQAVAASLLGVSPDKVKINTTWAGGSFGRRTTPTAPYVAEVIGIAQALRTDRPVKLLWTREDDMRGGFYRPMYVHKVAIGVDADGAMTGWRHRIVGQSILTGTPFESLLVRDGIDDTSVEGVKDHAYAIPNFRGELHTTQVGVPPLWWRSVGHTHTAYVMETAIDQAAAAAGVDPVDYRRGLIAEDDRRRGVLDAVARMANWSGADAENGRFRGVALHKSFSTYVAQIAEISIEDGAVKVHDVWCAVDCGVAVNPDNIVSQMEGGLGYGLGAILRNRLTIVDGVVEDGNFDTYPPLVMSDMPRMHVEIIPSTGAPTGVGEPGTPPIGPAVANAVFAATGTLLTTPPFSSIGFA